MAQLVEQRIRNAQVVDADRQGELSVVWRGFYLVEENFKIQYATKNLTLFYRVRFCSFIRFSAQDHLLTIYEFATFPPSKFPIVFATFSCMESVTCI